ncbi:inward rectifier potassium channel [Anaeramoeba ignava]|uniref:Inward rectifier potassium channel n=1 Tax=Anaeramoeba ignava TaxID=1746090 RepID=A0A9Q0LU05_ANAIG|nr:inward rectifier potassium channel [Anaeramoeba ignava]
MQNKKFKRLISNDQKIHISRTGKAKYKSYINDIFHTLMEIPWPVLLAIIVAVYIIVYFIFAVLYYLDKSCLDATMRSLKWCFFFSIQTQATIGYGYISPGNCIYANTIAYFQCCWGLIQNSATIGLIYKKFSRSDPRSKSVLFSNSAVISEYNGIRSLMFRVINTQNHQFIESQISLFLTRTIEKENNKKIFQFEKLEISTPESPDLFLALPCLVVHKLDENSPLYNVTSDSLNETLTELIVIVEGIDSPTSDCFQARKSYIPNEIFFDYKFLPVIDRKTNGHFQIKFPQFDSMIPTKISN